MVQDVSSMLVTEILGVSGIRQMDGTNLDSGILAVDVCAAPGGKSMHLAEQLEGKGKVISRDLTEYKVSLIRNNIERMGYQNIEASVHDALSFDEKLKEKADVVFADLPCSGLGIIGKKRDIKYRISKEDLEELQNLQRQILDVVWQYVKPGGVLIYSTCTINPGRMSRWQNGLLKTILLNLLICHLACRMRLRKKEKAECCSSFREYTKQTDFL